MANFETVIRNGAIFAGSGGNATVASWCPSYPRSPH